MLINYGLFNPIYPVADILPFYFTQALKFNETESTTQISLWTSICYVFPLLGALLSDSFLGKFWTILMLGSAYVVGQVLFTMASTGDAAIEAGGLFGVNLPVQ